MKVGDLVKVRSRPWYGIITETLNNRTDIHVVWTDNAAHRDARAEWVHCRELEVLSASR